jgi:hypothetical protein
MVDRTTKILLLLIAVGLWANVLIAQIRVAKADEDYSGFLTSIDRSLLSISGGICRNDKIC